MKQLAVHNPFDAPVFHEDTVDSTMNVSRALARQGQPHGTVISADFQEAGRGRIKGRSWNMERGTNLAFTILLRYPDVQDIPRALSLRTGLAVSLAIEDFASAFGGTDLAGKVFIKWPNDVLIGKAQAARKAVGILVEADGGNVHIGIGVNVAQRQFPDFPIDKVTSISIATGQKIADGERYALLENILTRLHAEIDNSGGGAAGWRGRIEERLYRKGEQVCFAEGPADSGKMAAGVLCGIGPEGELLIAPSGGPEGEMVSFTTGELRW